MTKRLKKILIISLSALMLIASVLLIGFGFSPANTYAGTDVQIPKDEGSDFYFEPGAAIGAGLSENNYVLRFKLKLNNPTIENVSKIQDNKMPWGSLFAPASDVYINKFTIRRANDDGSTTDLVTFIHYYYIESYSGLGKIVRLTGIKNISYYDESINIFGFDTRTGENGETTDGWYNGWGNSEHADKLYNDGYQYVAKDCITSTSNNAWAVTIRLNSPYAQYYVKFDYSYYTLTKKGFLSLGDEYKYISTGTAYSQARSVYTVLNNMNNAGMLESELKSEENVARAREIISDASLQTVTVKYLERIGNTPFAKAETAIVKVPVLSQGVFPDDVGAYIGKKDFSVLYSNIKGFAFNQSSGMYEAQYYDAAWLRSMTTDGKYLDYFLNIDQSYHDVYGLLVDKGVLTQGAYEYLFSDLLNKNPSLTGYTPDQVYGYFGFATIPKTMTFDTLFVEIFDIETSCIGAVKTFEYRDLLSAEAYNALLEEYKYGWLAKLWGNTFANLIGNTEATHYVFYSEGQPAIIGEGGQQDPNDDDGAIENTVQGVVGGVWGFVTGFFTGNGGWNSIITLVIIAGVIVLIYYFAKPGKKRRK